MERIVVGIDGSEGAEAALRWAHAEAKLRAADLHAVLVWENPWFDQVPGVGTLTVPDDIVLDQANGTLQAAMGAAVDPADTSVNVTSEVLPGKAGNVLVDLSADAALLVVGRRDHTGLLGRRFGAVSSHVLHHAGCPVVVVPRPEAVDEGSRGREAR